MSARSLPALSRCGGQHLLSLLAMAWSLAPIAEGAGWAPTLEVRATWNDNITNANRSTDQIDALSTGLDAGAATRIGLASNDALLLSGHLASDWTPRFDDLREHGLGGRAEWEHKFGLGPLVPTIGIELAVDAIVAADRDREGIATAGRVTLRKRFDDLWRATVSQDFGRRGARSPIFDQQSRETSVAVARSVGDLWHVTVRASYRDGDVVSYGTPPRPDLVSLAPNRTSTTTFGRAMVAYSIDASSIAADVTAARAIGNNSSLSIGCTHRETRRSPLVYVNNLVSVSIGHRF